MNAIQDHQDLAPIDIHGYCYVGSDPAINKLQEELDACEEQRAIKAGIEAILGFLPSQGIYCQKCSRKSDVVYLVDDPNDLGRMMVCAECTAACAAMMNAPEEKIAEILFLSEHFCKVLRTNAAAEARKREMTENNERRQSEYEAYIEEHGLLEAWGGSCFRFEGHANTVIEDIWGKYCSGYTLTEKQIAVCRRIAREEIERADILKDAPAIEGGRYELTLEIKTLKEQQTPYGYQRKMTCEDVHGNRYYGTCPSFLVEAGVESGDVVTFTAKVTPKTEHFAFISNPRQPKS